MICQRQTLIDTRGFDYSNLFFARNVFSDDDQVEMEWQQEFDQSPGNRAIAQQHDCLSFEQVRGSAQFEHGPGPVLKLILIGRWELTCESQHHRQHMLGTRLAVNSGTIRKYYLVSNYSLFDSIVIEWRVSGRIQMHPAQRVRFNNCIWVWSSVGDVCGLECSNRNFVVAVKPQQFVLTNSLGQ